MWRRLLLLLLCCLTVYADQYSITCTFEMMNHPAPYPGRAQVLVMDFGEERTLEEWPLGATSLLKAYSNIDMRPWPNKRYMPSSQLEYDERFNAVWSSADRHKLYIKNEVFVLGSSWDLVYYPKQLSQSVIKVNDAPSDLFYCTATQLSVSKLLTQYLIGNNATKFWQPVLVFNDQTISCNLTQFSLRASDFFWVSLDTFQTRLMACNADGIPGNGTLITSDNKVWYCGGSGRDLAPQALGTFNLMLVPRSTVCSLGLQPASNFTSMQNVPPYGSLGNLVVSDVDNSQGIFSLNNHSLAADKRSKFWFTAVTDFSISDLVTRSRFAAFDTAQMNLGDFFDFGFRGSNWLSYTALPSLPPAGFSRYRGNGSYSVVEVEPYLNVAGNGALNRYGWYTNVTNYTDGFPLAGLHGCKRYVEGNTLFLQCVTNFHAFTEGSDVGRMFGCENRVTNVSYQVALAGISNEYVTLSLGFFNLGAGADLLCYTQWMDRGNFMVYTDNPGWLSSTPLVLTKAQLFNRDAGYTLNTLDMYFDTAEWIWYTELDVTGIQLICDEQLATLEPIPAPIAGVARLNVTGCNPDVDGPTVSLLNDVIHTNTRSNEETFNFPVTVPWFPRLLRSFCTTDYILILEFDDPVVPLYTAPMNISSTCSVPVVAKGVADKRVFLQLAGPDSCTIWFDVVTEVQAIIQISGDWCQPSADALPVGIQNVTMESAAVMVVELNRTIDSAAELDASLVDPSSYAIACEENDLASRVTRLLGFSDSVLRFAVDGCSNDTDVTVLTSSRFSATARFTSLAVAPEVGSNTLTCASGDTTRVTATITGDWVLESGYATENSLCTVTGTDVWDKSVVFTVANLTNIDQCTLVANVSLTTSPGFYRTVLFPLQSCAFAQPFDPTGEFSGMDDGNKVAFVLFVIIGLTVMFLLAVSVAYRLSH